MAQKKGFSPMKKISFEKIWNDLGEVLDEEKTIHTLAKNCPNEIIDIDNDGIWVMTEKSSPNSEQVPRWMFKRAIEYLIEHGSLSNSTLVKSLNVKRSSFVMAALSRLDYIGYEINPLRIFLIN